MTKNPPNRRGIVFEVGAQLEARDRLKKWYAALIEEINFEEGKVLIHFKHWNHRHDEWFCWDSPDLRPEEKIQLRKEGLHEEPVQPEFRVNQQVLACWSDCRFYPAKITAANKDGTYTVKFFDGVVQTVKSIHVKSAPKDQNATCAKPKERNKEVPSQIKKQKCNEPRNSTDNAPKEKNDRPQNIENISGPDKDKLVGISEKINLDGDEVNLIDASGTGKKDPEKDKLFVKSEETKQEPEIKRGAICEKSRTDTDNDTLVAILEKSKLPELCLPKNDKEDKENISENDRESLVDKHTEEKKIENNSQNTPREKRGLGRKLIRPPSHLSDSASQTLQPIILELRRRTISIAVEVHSKRPRLEKSMHDSPSIHPEKPTQTAHTVENQEKLNKSSDGSKKAQIYRRSSRRSSSGIQEVIHAVHVTQAPGLVEPLIEHSSSPKDLSQDDPLSILSEKPPKPAHSYQSKENLNTISDHSERARIPRRSSRRSPSDSREIFDVLNVTPTPAVAESLKEQASNADEHPEDLKSVGSSEKPTTFPHSVESEEKFNNPSDNRDKSQTPRRSSRLSSSSSQEMLDVCHVTPVPTVVEPLQGKTSSQKESPEVEVRKHEGEKVVMQIDGPGMDDETVSRLVCTEEVEQCTLTHLVSVHETELDKSIQDKASEVVDFPLLRDYDLQTISTFEKLAKPSHCEEKLTNSSDNSEMNQIIRRSPRQSSSSGPELMDVVHVTPAIAVVEPAKEQATTAKEPPEVLLESSCSQFASTEIKQVMDIKETSEIGALERSITAEEGKTESTSFKHPEVKEIAALPVSTTLKKNNDPLASKVLTTDFDHSKLKCKLKDCSKLFRKAKHLLYHMKYFHGVDKAEKLQKPVTRTIQTRGSVANEKACQEIPKRRRTTSGSFYAPLRLELRGSPTDDKMEKRNEKRRHSLPSLNTLNTHRTLRREKGRDNHLNKSHRKHQEREKQNDNASKEKEKRKEKKSKNLFKLKLKKKKKKKKKSKSEYSGSEENIEISQELSPKKLLSLTKSSAVVKSPHCHESMPLESSDLGHLKDQVKKKEEDTLSDSSANSLLWSEDEYSQEIDVTTNAEEALNEDERDFEIVRCRCEAQEENDFMIQVWAVDRDKLVQRFHFQCEECLCWQHGVCMGLLEDHVPEKYTCFICRNPPGQRSGLKFWYDKEWLNNGHLHGLSFLDENYSHQNAKKIVATHQLLGDVHRVIELLHGLQLKMSILQSKDHQDLKHWCLPWKPRNVDHKCYPRHHFHAENCCKEDTTNYRTFNGAVEKPSIPSVEESYITSEHCYQKPRAYYPAMEQRLVVETRGSAMDDGVSRVRENGDDSIADRLRWELDKDKRMMESDSKHNYCKIRECMPKKSSLEETMEMKLMDNNGDSVLNTQLQWQLNLLNHVESLQDEVTHRMDFIEKELDVLESFLDYTGELEPPEPLARLPQLKHRVKQLLMDLGKVQQIARCCSTCV